MKRTRLSIIIHPFISILVISLVTAGVLFFIENNVASEPPINYSDQDNLFIFFVTILWTYFTLIIALGIPCLLMEFFEVKQIFHAIIYGVIAIVCMFLPTILKEYNWSFIFVTIAFFIIDVLSMKRNTNTN